MNKSDLIQALADGQNITIKDASEIINTIVSTMSESLKEGNNIEIRGFGSFTVKQYGSYIGRNPKTGEKITVKPKKQPFFKPGKDLRDAVNRSTI